jgi:small redox-active disulfide protein 2
MSASISVIEVLGPGCARCHETHRVVQHVVDEAKLGCVVQKSTSIDRMIELGVLSSPALAIDGKVVLSGRIPKTDEVRRLLGLEPR